MQLPFEPNLDYQLQAIEAVTVTRDTPDSQLRLPFAESAANRAGLRPTDTARLGVGALV